MDFSEMYDQYHDRVRKFILHMVRDEWIADDLTQEAFARAMENVNAIADPAKISSWLFRVASNLCRDHFRGRKRAGLRHLTKGEEGFEEVDVIPFGSIQERMEQDQMGTCVQRQMGLLPESLRSVLVLYDIMDFNHKEIADVLEMTVANVKVRLHRARKRLKGILEQKCHFENDERDVLVCVPR